MKGKFQTSESLLYDIGRKSRFRSSADRMNMPECCCGSPKGIAGRRHDPDLKRRSGENRSHTMPHSVDKIHVSGELRA
jgi:hypothetical protein